MKYYCPKDVKKRENKKAINILFYSSLSRRACNGCVQGLAVACKRYYIITYTVVSSHLHGFYPFRRILYIIQYTHVYIIYELSSLVSRTFVLSANARRKSVTIWLSQAIFLFLSALTIFSSHFVIILCTLKRPPFGNFAYMTII